MLAKLPQLVNGSGKTSTRRCCDFFDGRVTSSPDEFISDMERERQGHYWTAEGFLIDDHFRAAAKPGPVYADRQLVVTRTKMPPGLRFAGEIDLSNSGAVGQSIRIGFGETPEPHIDLSRLSFCDVSGIRALIDAALELGGGRRLLLHGLPEQLQTVLRVTGWSSMASLGLCSCAGRAA